MTTTTLLKVFKKKSFKIQLPNFEKFIKLYYFKCVVLFVIIMYMYQEFVRISYANKSTANGT
jgi:hypothetical protein